MPAGVYFLAALQIRFEDGLSVSRSSCFVLPVSLLRSMHELSEFLLRYGYWLTFGSVFAEQFGLPLPAVPVLISIGALSGSDRVSMRAIILVAVIGGLAADLIWYRLGSRYGHSVLRVICRISLEPDFCVRRTEDAFVRHGMWALPIAKFVPGLNAAAVPLAGMIQSPLHRFVVFDVVGLFLWTGVYVAVGYVFRNEVARVIAYLSQLGNSLLVILSVILAAYVVYKAVQRRRFRNTLAMNRITPEELKSKLESKEDVLIVDLRNPLDIRTDRIRIPGAFHILPESLQYTKDDIPRDKDIVLYCT
jgi:membrane protein DedA with SNARE-associated domain